MSTSKPSSGVVESDSEPSASPTGIEGLTDCESDEDCTGAKEFCNATQSPPSCSCPANFFRLGGNCQAENFCGDSSRNNCDTSFAGTEFAASECNDLNPGFACRCRIEIGWQDAPGSVPGTNCIDRSECELGEDDCDKVTSVCVNRVPANGRWECVEKTPAPTPFPTRSPLPDLPKCISDGDVCSLTTSGNPCCEECSICSIAFEAKIRTCYLRDGR